MSHGVFRILTVCTGNICRSPAAERLLAAQLPADGTVAIASAGTHAMVGKPIQPQMAELVAQAGADPTNFAAFQLADDEVQQADLILALTRAHRQNILELTPGAVRRTFTLREFARLASGVDTTELPRGTAAQRLQALLPLAVAQRGRIVADPDDDDVVDPYRRSGRTYELSFNQLHPATQAIAALVWNPA